MEDMEPCEKRIKLSKVEAVSCPILDKRETSRLVKEFGTNLPLGDLQHLKRVRPSQVKNVPLEILVSPLSAIIASQDDSSAEITPGLVNDFLLKQGISSSGLGPPNRVRVCSRQPTTRQQFNDARLHWPTNFHENKELAKKVTKQVFNEKQLRKHAAFMRQAIEQAKLAGSIGEPVGAVVVDPASQTVIAAGHDQRHRHPLQHVTMVVVDLVARAQGGGAWDLQGEAAAARAESTKDEGAGSGIKEGPYLCTGYDLYITREPCCLCAMALVHSRIRTVFYGSATPHGALGTLYKMNCKTGLNHHYDVYSGFLKEECEVLHNSGGENVDSDPSTMTSNAMFIDEANTAKNVAHEEETITKDSIAKS